MESARLRTPQRAASLQRLDPPSLVGSPPQLDVARQSGFFAYNPEKEPIKAYLRLRPKTEHGASHEKHDSLMESMSQPYLQVVDDHEIAMMPPADSNAYRTRNRAPERYRFTKIFTDRYRQQPFFASTTLPLIKDVLSGENALVFAYGVTNSGKTHSIMGHPSDPGILPRTLDVVFNSIQDFIGDSKATDPWQSAHIPIDRDTTAVQIDQGFEYNIWVSYAEIYTERIYDLLVPPDRHQKRKPLSLKYEFRSGHKYISGLKEVKVQSIEEAYTLLLQGQRHRAVYSTLMNHASSRSHSIFTIRIVRLPIVENDYVIDDPSFAMVSKMTIVDLAGSERYRNTFNTGIRLKEAGNVNKSLMVLGQCMETLRLNQLKASLGKRPAIVPFRHSKLTELFKSSFEGDGKAVMIVNVNSFDTGFDENSHVMKFAAVAKDVATWRRIHPKLDMQHASANASKRRRAISSQQSQGNRSSTPTFVVIPLHLFFFFSLVGLDTMTEDEQADDRLTEDEDEDEELEDPFVDNLIAQWADLRDKWIDAETRCASMEAEVRQQVAKETAHELRQMEDLYMSTISRREMLTIELERMKTRLADNDITKQSLLDKQLMLDLKREREQQQPDTVDAMDEDLPEQEQSPSLLLNDAPADDVAVPMSQTSSAPGISATEKFEQFLDLRKRLRRAVFKNEQYDVEANNIMSQIEQFEDVTFDLVKETNMGKLLKLISQHSFMDDPSALKQRATGLLKKYIQCSIATLAPERTTSNKRDSVVHVSVDAGKEEELISDMRDALDSLQDENTRLKHKLKTMEYNQRRLAQAFDNRVANHLATDSLKARTRKRRPHFYHFFFNFFCIGKRRGTRYGNDVLIRSVGTIVG
ncbi:kinesin-domain-containing protein [Hesseltinella vesiculosa]|uniref:Kinesin-like protein n=1 Tax=Hesseltinella vesiculosa TaxID=101127 RepID=A0A1X2GET3_9FUNG|nr:kinesin-domain-containing protein [Hesseltinella vesiculosa]